MILINNNYFKYYFNKPSSYGFHGLALNFFIKEVLSKRKDKMSVQLYFRLFRTGLIGDVLYKSSVLTIKDKEYGADNEMLAAFFESYLVLARSIFDYLLLFLKEQYDVEESSYNDFLKKVKKGKYENLEKKFKKHLDNNFFSDLRNLRDSTIHKTSNLFIDIKNKKYWVFGTLHRDNGTRETVDESLHFLVFGYTTALLLLMSYVAEKETGKTLKEQLKTVNPEKTKKYEFPNTDTNNAIQKDRVNL